jgi:hypothetical protein
MDPERHERFTRHLARWAEGTSDVVGLVAVGSTARVDRQPDRWSDHDILVVTRPGVAERIRASTTWLPDPHRIVLAFNEPDHGLTVIYDDGHLIELAVAEIADVGWFRADAYRVLVDNGGVASTLEVHAQAADDAAGSLSAGLKAYHALLKELVIVVGRLGRGEELSATQHLHGVALPHLLTLIRRCVPTSADDRADPYDPTRRFESAYPDIAEALDESRGRPEALVATFVELLRTHVVGHVQGTDLQHVAPIAALVADLRSAGVRSTGSPGTA